MPAPAHKVNVYGSELGDWCTPIPVARIEWIVADLKRALKAGGDPIERTHVALGFAYVRLGRHEDALHHLRNAMHYNPIHPMYKVFAAAALLNVQKPMEALDLLATVGDLTGHDQVLLLANTAEALADVGMFAEAREVFAEALCAADPTNPFSVLALANQAAEIDADREAVELFARYLRLRQGKPRGADHPLTVIADAEADRVAALDQMPTQRLRAAVHRATTFGRALFDSVPMPLLDRSADEIAAADAATADAYDAMLPLRGRANAEAMAEGDRGA